MIVGSNVSAMSCLSFYSFWFLFLVTTYKFNLVECSESDGDAVDDSDDEHLVHIGKIDKDSCTVDKEMEVTFAGVQVLCGENYFLAGFDKKPTVILNRANVVSVNLFDNVKKTL